MKEALPIKIIYICSLRHSGSTLLDLLISDHPDIFSGGEFKINDPEVMNAPCTCGARTVYECPIWSKVNTFIETNYNLSLDTLRINSIDRDVFRKHNYILMKSIKEATSQQFILDSRKSIHRFLRLYNEKDIFTVYPIFLRRSLFGVIASQKKKKAYKKYTKNLWKYYFRYNFECIQYVKHRKKAIYFLEYENMVSKPLTVMNDIMTKIGLNTVNQKFIINLNKQHNIGGNRMRRNSNIHISHDDSWKTTLNNFDKMFCFIFGMPAYILFLLASYRSMKQI